MFRGPLKELTGQPNGMMGFFDEKKFNLAGQDGFQYSRYD